MYSRGVAPSSDGDKYFCGLPLSFADERQPSSCSESSRVTGCSDEASKNPPSILSTSVVIFGIMY